MGMWDFDCRCLPVFTCVYLCLVLYEVNYILQFQDGVLSHLFSIFLANLGENAI